MTQCCPQRSHWPSGTGEAIEAAELFKKGCLAYVKLYYSMHFFYGIGKGSKGPYWLNILIIIEVNTTG
jgi:hypothetical protein